MKNIKTVNEHTKHNFQCKKEIYLRVVPVYIPPTTLIDVLILKINF